MSNFLDGMDHDPVCASSRGGRCWTARAPTMMRRRSAGRWRASIQSEAGSTPRGPGRARARRPSVLPERGVGSQTTQESVAGWDRKLPPGLLTSRIRETTCGGWAYGADGRLRAGGSDPSFDALVVGATKQTIKAAVGSREPLRGSRPRNASGAQRRAPFPVDARRAAVPSRRHAAASARSEPPECSGMDRNK